MDRRMATYRLAAIVGSLAFVLYLPALQDGFVNWDDDVYVFDNIHIWTFNLAFLRWAFSDLSQGFWHPVTWISHAADYAFWGLNPTGHHLTAILLHALNTFFVVVLIVRLMDVANTALNNRFAGGKKPSGGENGLGSAYPLQGGDEGEGGQLPFPDTKAILITAGVTGILFGIHPVHVESVAWVAQRKDLLCAFFSILSIIVYIEYAKSVTSRSYRHYALSFVFFILALSSKSMAVSLPVVLMLLDWYPLARLNSGRDVMFLLREKLPFIAFSVIFSAVSFFAQKAMGAMSFMATVPLASRVLIAFRALATYLLKMLWPFDLLPVYPYPKDISLLLPEYLFVIAIVCCISAACIYTAGRQRLWSAAWIYYCVSLLPVLGIIGTNFVPMADRYTYLPGLGPFFVAGITIAWAWWRAGLQPRWGQGLRWSFLCLALSLTVFLSYRAVQQILVWKDSTTLWNYVIQKAPGQVPAAYNNRGIMFTEAKQYDRALEDFNAAIALEPSPLGYNNRGMVLKRIGRVREAIEDYARALSLDPGYHVAFNNRGLAFKDMGQSTLAVADFTAALAIRPDYAPAYTNRGLLFGELGELDLAIGDFTAAVTVNPFYSDAYISRGLSLERKGMADLAIADYNKAISLEPGNDTAYLNRGVALERMEKYDLAAADYSRAIALKPDDHQAYINRGIVLSKTGRSSEAVEDFQKACSLGSHEGCEALNAPAGR